KTALVLVAPGPPARARVLTGQRPRGARLAADRRVAVGEQRVDDQAVALRVRGDLLVGPRRDRVDLDDAVALVPAHERGVRAGGGLAAAHTGRPRLVVRQGLAHRGDLAHRAARLGVAVVQAGAVDGVLLRDRQRGADV